MALIDINRIRLDGGTQHRVRTDTDAVAEYADAYLDGKKMPPVKVIHDGKHHWLWDGFHRIAGALQAGKKSISADVESGTQQEAFERSLGANTDHGIRRSNEDKRAAVTAALQNEVTAALSDRQIAKLCGVSNTMVASARSPKDRIEHPAGTAPKAPPAVAETPAEGVNVYTAENPNTAPSAEEEQPEPSTATAPDTSTQQPGPTTTKTPGKVPLGSLEAITRERDELREQNAELVAQLEEAVAEVAALSNVVDAEDAAKQWHEELRKERARAVLAEERLQGAINEKNEAIRAAQGWKRKAEGR